MQKNYTSKWWDIHEKFIETITTIISYLKFKENYEDDKPRQPGQNLPRWYRANHSVFWSVEAIDLKNGTGKVTG